MRVRQRSRDRCGSSGSSKRRQSARGRMCRQIDRAGLLCTRLSCRQRVGGLLSLSRTASTPLASFRRHCRHGLLGPAVDEPARRQREFRAVEVRVNARRHAASRRVGDGAAGTVCRRAQRVDQPLQVQHFSRGGRVRQGVFQSPPARAGSLLVFCRGRRRGRGSDGQVGVELVPRGGGGFVKVGFIVADWLFALELVRLGLALLGCTCCCFRHCLCLLWRRFHAHQGSTDCEGSMRQRRVLLLLGSLLARRHRRARTLSGVHELVLRAQGRVGLARGRCRGTGVLRAGDGWRRMGRGGLILGGQDR